MNERTFENGAAARIVAEANLYEAALSEDKGATGSALNALQKAASDRRQVERAVQSVSTRLSLPTTAAAHSLLIGVAAESLSVDSLMDMARWATENGQLTLLSAIHEIGADLFDKRYPLINSAIAHSQMATMEFLISITDFSHTDDSDFTPLAFAACEGQVAAVERLLREPAALQNGSGTRALIWCEGHGETVDTAMAELLLAALDVDKPSYPFDSCALISMARVCGSEALGRTVAKRSSWGHECAIVEAILHGHPGFAAGIAGAIGEPDIRQALLSGDCTTGHALAHRKGRFAEQPRRAA